MLIALEISKPENKTAKFSTVYTHFVSVNFRNSRVRSFLWHVLFNAFNYARFMVLKTVLPKIQIF
jgi:hypothetical protein